MIIFRADIMHRKEHTFFVTPGVFHPGVSDFMEDGRPKMFAVDFHYGKSEELPDGLARFMVDHGFAQTSPLILPQGARRG